MKQVLQNLKTGELEVAELPSPQVRKGALLIQTRASLISAGTERMIVEFSKANLISKARQQPEKVKQVLDKIKTDGLLPTLEAVFSKLDEPMPLGYCNAGVVLDVGSDVSDFVPGDRVISNGPHAEIVCVPKNLCAKIPEGISDESAAFTVLSSVGLQGIRLLSPSLGEKFVVYGLGLVGLLSVQLLRAHGCEVIGIDLNPARLKLAQGYGARIVTAGSGGDLVSAANAWTEGKGVDGVLITAAAKTDEIIQQSAQMCRKRGRIVLVGVVGLNLRRSDFYEKEITFQVSCSYGPGRYDNKYEQSGQDYPRGFVRWTAQRNFQAVLDIMQAEKLNVDDLITNRFALEDASQAYDVVIKSPHALGVILKYVDEVEQSPKLAITSASVPAAHAATVSVIGAGNFSKMILVPSISKAGGRIAYIADLNAAAAQHLAKKYVAENAVTDYRLLLQDPEVNAVLIAVPHNLHARLVCEAIEAGKHVFVEKPLAMNENELSNIIEVVTKAKDRFVMVGFNRRFSPHTVKLEALLAGRSEPLCMNMIVNAGYISPEHWVHDPVVGGGRIIGEGCHFFDLMVHLTRSRIKTVASMMVGQGVAVCEDKMSIILGFEDGSIGTVNYFANGSKKYPKETLEVFSEGRVARLENFRIVLGYGFKNFRKFKTARQDKGHRAEFAAFVDLVANGGDPLIPLDQLVNVTRASFAAVESAKTGKTIEIEC
ncbi:MAG: zinc-binding dehydrogenase [Planctomycetes bacterium]|nr:zinc-binding dehydrogenase [Planctomycetota bacterium]